jgi:hypothetical protein
LLVALLPWVWSPVTGRVRSPSEAAAPLAVGEPSGDPAAA